jgi:DNA-binding PadR family transcriptional regulator
MTFATASVLQALAAGYRYGFDIVEVVGVRGGTVYPLLRRLEARGVVSAEWEEAEIGRHEGRPSRRYYRLTAEGDALVQEATRRFPIALESNATARLQETWGKG